MKKVPAFRYQVLLALLLIFCSRLPFLNNGYGAEEDSWGLAHIAKVMALTHVYEASRLPGHPLQEYIYSMIWDQGAFVFNLFTAIISTAGVLFFILALKKLNIQKPVLTGVALAFVPIVFINSTNNMDYTWALAMMLAAFYFLISGKYFPSGIMLALAIGCRITSGIMFPVFLYYIWRDQNENKLRAALRLSLTTVFLSSIIFLPVFLTYGISFLTATDYFPYPPLAKVLYKGSIGVFGTLGFIATVSIPFVYWRNKSAVTQAEESKKHKLIFQVSMIIIIIYTLAYALKPEKSAYLAPVIPFVILVASLIFPPNKMTLFLALLAASSFVAGINLEDNFRGNTKSPLAISHTIAGQKIAFDLLQGPLMADYYKRKNKISFTAEIINKIRLCREKTIIIAGWWYNEIIVELPSEKKGPVEFIFYADENELVQYKRMNYSIFYLPEQNTWNDLRYKKIFTEKYAKAWD